MRSVILSCLGAFILILFLFSCSNEPDMIDTADLTSETSNPSIEYWAHTIDSSEMYFVSGSPYGYYEVIYYDAKLSGEYWYDVWFVANDGSWYRTAPFYDSNISIWYNVLYLYDGSLAFNTPIDMTGCTMVVFRAEISTAKSKGIKDMQGFNAKDYFDNWPPDINDTE